MDIARQSRKNAAIDPIAETQRHAGKDIDLLIAGHGRLDLQAAVKPGHRIARFEPLFFGEPTLPDNIEVLAEDKA